MRTAVQYLGKVGVGATAPEFFRADDDKIYVVKQPYGCGGKKVLISEALAAAFGKRLGLPFPGSGPICLQKFFPERAPAEQLGFGSEYIFSAVYATNRNILRAVNLAAMGGVVVFDHMFHNADRANNRKNLLLANENGTFRVYAIDHSHLFRTAHWTKDTLCRMENMICVYARFLYGTLLHNILKPTDLYPVLQQIKDLTNADIQRLLAEIPIEWLDAAGEERDALTHFIQRRIQCIEDIAAALTAKMQI